MKINNRIVACLLTCVCSFVSCSKDDGPELPQGPVEVIVSFAATAETNTTKAATNEDEKTGTATENFIGNLATFIFDENGDLLGSSTKVAAGEETITEAEPILIKIVKEAKYTAVLIANYGKAFTPASMSTLAKLKAETVTNDIGAYVEKSNLPMVSKQITFSGENLKPKGDNDSPTRNWINDAGTVAAAANNGSVKLQRLISRVDVERIAASFLKYPNASLRIDSFALINVKSKASIEKGLAPIVKGHQYKYYAPVDKWIKENSPIVEQLAGTGIFVDNGNMFEHGTSIEKNNEFGSGWTGGAIFSSYTFSNTKDETYKTALLISGWFKYDKKDKDETAKRRHYRVFLADPDPETSLFQVRPNYLYKIFVTITGEGSENEDKIEENVDVQVAITAEPWNVKTQDVGGEI